MAYTTINKSTDYFNTKLYSGNGTNNHAITGVGFQPDWVWIKLRSGADNHILSDAVRGANKQIYTNLTEAEGTATTMLQSFNSDGFSLGTDGAVNNSSGTLTSWNWKANGTGSANTDGTINSTVSANTTSGFSIVSYTGNGSAGATIGHGLGVKPAMIIIKSRSRSGDDWLVYHKNIGATKDLRLNLSNAATTNSSPFNNTEPTSSLFTVGTGSAVNTNNATNIAYCFVEKQGYSKFGSYTGNGSTDGTFIYTGFKPAFVMLKKTTNENWLMLDNKRGAYNFVDEFLQPNTNGAEANHNITGGIDILSNGMKLRHGDGTMNSSGAEYIYMAFAEAPLVGTNNIPATAR